MKVTMKGIVAMGLFSTILGVVGCDRVATGELQAGQSTVVAEGGGHIIILKEIPAGQGFRGGNTIPGKEVARLMCDYAPSAKEWKHNDHAPHQ